VPVKAKERGVYCRCHNKSPVCGGPSVLKSDLVGKGSQADHSRMAPSDALRNERSLSFTRTSRVKESSVDHSPIRRIIMVDTGGVVTAISNAELRTRREAAAAATPGPPTTAISNRGDVFQCTVEGSVPSEINSRRLHCSSKLAGRTLRMKFTATACDVCMSHSIAFA
jgi:hypothetical protein